MANEKKIIDSVKTSVDALSESFKTIDEVLKKSKDGQKQLITNLREINKKLSKSKSLKQFVTLQKKMNDEQLRLNKTQQAAIDLSKKNEQRKQQVIKTQQAAVIATKKEQLENEKLKQSKMRTAKAERSANEQKEKATRASKEASRAYNVESKRLLSLTKRAKDAAIQYGINSKQARRLTKEQQKLDRQLKKIDASLGQHTRSVGNYRSALEGLRKNFGALVIGITAAVAVFRSFSRMFSSSTRTFIEFENRMAKVAAISEATSSELVKLKNQARELGKTSQNSASQVAGLQLELSKLGFNTDEILDATEKINDLSIATGEDLAKSATVVAGNIKAFELEASEAGRISDVMAKGFSSSALDLEKFNTATAKAGTVLKTSGRSVEEMTAQLGVLVDRNLDASTAGTSLRNIYLELSKRGMTLSEAFSEINNASDASAKSLELFGKRSSTAAVILAQNQEETLKLTDSLNNSAGAASQMAKIMADNLSGDTKEASSAIEGLQIALGDKLEPTARKTTKRFTEFVGWLIKVAKGNKEALQPIKNIVDVLKVLTPAVIAYMVATKASFAVDKLKLFWNNTIIASFKRLYVTMMANPYAAIAAAVAGIAAAIYLLSQRQTRAEKAQEHWNKAADEATDALQNQSAELNVLKRRLRDNETRTNKLRESMRGISTDSAEYTAKNRILQGVEEDRSEIISTLNTKFGDYIEGNIAVSDSHEDQLGFIEDINEALRDQIKLKATEAITKDIMKQAVQAEKELLKLGSMGEFVQKNQSFWRTEGGLKVQYLKEKKGLQNHLDSLLDEYNDFSSELDKLFDEQPKPDAKPKPAAPGQPKMPGQVEAFDMQNTLSSYEESYKTMEEMDQEYLDGYLDKEQQKTDAIREQEERRKELRRQTEEEIYNLGKALGNAYFETKAEQYKDEREANQKHYDKLLANEKLTQEQRDLLEAKRQKKDNEIREKERENERNQFLFEQSVAIGKIWMATAVNIAKHPLLAPIYTSIAAIQTGIVAVQTIPQLDKGTESTPETYIAGEKRSEIRVDKKGKAEVIDKPTLFQDDPGAKIIGGADTSKLMDSVSNYTNSQIVNNGDKVTGQDALIGKLVSRMIDENSKGNKSIIKELQKNRPKQARETTIDKMRTDNLKNRLRN